MHIGINADLRGKNTYIYFFELQVASGAVSLPMQIKIAKAKIFPSISILLGFKGEPHIIKAVKNLDPPDLELLACCHGHACL